MDYKKDILKKFSATEDLIVYRYYSSTIIFILSSLVFFLNYFFVGARFKDDIFSVLLPYNYVVFLISFLFYIFFFFKNTFKFPGKYDLFFLIFGGILFVVFLFPISGISF